MPLPAPSRNFQDSIDTPPPLDGTTFVDRVASNGQRLFDMVPNVLGSIGGSADAIIASASPVLLAAPVDGQLFVLIPTAPNTGAVTVNTDGQGAIALRDWEGNALAGAAYEAAEPLLFRYVAASSHYRLTHLTFAQQIAAAIAEFGDASFLEQIGDSGSLGTVAQVEFTFTAGRYSKIWLIASDVLTSATATLLLSLRNASGSILDRTTESVGNTITRTYSMEMTIGLINATKKHTAFFYGFATSTTAPDSVGGSNATAPDRVRVAPSTGNLTAGRVIAYGWRATA